MQPKIYLEATIAKSTVVFKIGDPNSQADRSRSGPIGEEPTFERITTPTALQRRAFDLLDIPLKKLETSHVRGYESYLPTAGTLG